MGIDGREYARGGKTPGENMSGWKINWREYLWVEKQLEGICLGGKTTGPDFSKKIIPLLVC